MGQYQQERRHLLPRIPLIVVVPGVSAIPLEAFETQGFVVSKEVVEDNFYTLANVMKEVVDDAVAFRVPHCLEQRNY